MVVEEADRGADECGAGEEVGDKENRSSVDDRQEVSGDFVAEVETNGVEMFRDDSARRGVAEATGAILTYEVGRDKDGEGECL